MTPPGEARDDFDIFLALAEKLGVRNELYPGWLTTHDAFKEWQRISHLGGSWRTALTVELPVAAIAGD